MYIRLEHCNKLRYTFMIPASDLQVKLLMDCSIFIMIIMGEYIFSIFYYYFNFALTIFTIITIFLILLFHTKISNIEKKRKNKEFP